VTFKVYKDPNYDTSFFTLKTNRDWMDDSVDKQAYKCLPVTLANCLGWSFSLPEDISFILHSSTNTVEILSGHKYSSTDRTNGTISFRSGLTIQSDAPTSLLIMPVPNQFVDGVSPFTSVVNTSVLKSPVPSAWKITRYDEVITVKKDTPIAAIIPISLTGLQDVEFNLVDEPLGSDYFEYIEEYRKKFSEIISNEKYTNMYRDAVDHLGNPRGQHELKALRLKLNTKN
jgi:hypothetical protein